MEKAQADGTLKDYGVTWAVGTGPFKLESWTQGDNVTLARNTDYFEQDAQDQRREDRLQDHQGPLGAQDRLHEQGSRPDHERRAPRRPRDREAGRQDPHDQRLLRLPLPGLQHELAQGRPGQHGRHARHSTASTTSTPTPRSCATAILYSINPSDIVNSPDIMDKRGNVTLQYVETLPFGHIDGPEPARAWPRASKETGYYNPQKAKELFDALPAASSSPARSSAPRCPAASTSRKPWWSRTR